MHHVETPAGDIIMQKITVTLPYELKISAEEISKRKSILLSKLLSESIKDYFDQNGENKIDSLIRSDTVDKGHVHKMPSTVHDK
jgi:hypothetical protein